MQISDVKVFLVGEEKLKAFVSIVLDGCFMVNDIKVIEGREGLFISMPSRKKRNGQFKDVAHPLNQETRDWLEDQILSEYHRCLDIDRADDAEEDEEAREVEEVRAIAQDRASEPVQAPVAAPAAPPEVPPVAAASTAQASPRAELETPSTGDGPDETPPPELEDERSLDEVQRRHLSDSFWSVS